MVKKATFRGQVNVDLDHLVRAVVALRRLSLADITEEALQDWLKRPENQEIIDKHKLISS